MASMAVFTAAMNAFLSKVPACWASIVSTFAALAWPATSSVGGSAASCASFAFDAAGGWAFLALAKPLTLPFTCVNAGSSPGCHPGRRHGRLEQLVARTAGREPSGAAPPPPPPAPGALAAGAFAGAAGRLRRLRPGLAERRDGLGRLGSAAPASSAPPPQARSRSWSRRARWPVACWPRPRGRPGRRPPWSPSAPSRRSRGPARPRGPRGGRRRCRPRRHPSVLSLPAIRALTAELPANALQREQCRRAAAPGRPLGRRPPLDEALGDRVRGMLPSNGHLGSPGQTPGGQAGASSSCLLALDRAE